MLEEFLTIPMESNSLFDIDIVWYRYSIYWFIQTKMDSKITKNQAKHIDDKCDAFYGSTNNSGAHKF